MMKESTCILNAMICGLALNLLLPLLLKPLATPDEVKPPEGAASLSYKGQFMHMMVHHNQVPLMSSLIVMLIVGLSVFLGYKLKPSQRLLGF